MTRAAFDHDGYYKTGDVADKCGDEYVFRGRASSDCKCYHLYYLSQS